MNSHGGPGPSIPGGKVLDHKKTNVKKGKEGRIHNVGGKEGKEALTKKKTVRSEPADTKKTVSGGENTLYFPIPTQEEEGVKKTKGQ